MYLEITTKKDLMYKVTIWFIAKLRGKRRSVGTVPNKLRSMVTLLMETTVPNKKETFHLWGDGMIILKLACKFQVVTTEI